MRELVRMARPWAAVLFVSSFLVACGDDDPAAPDFTDEAASQVADVAEEAVAPFEASADIQSNLALAYGALLGFGGGGVSPMVPFQGQARMRAPFRMGAPVPAPAAPTGVLVPEEMEGLTFVWSSEQGTYVASDLSGAPDNGVRFLWYAIDPITEEPAEPLNALGHIDLTDESTDQAARLQIDVVRDAGDVTLADYFVQGAVTGNLETTTITIDSEGYMSDGTHDADFDMQFVTQGDETSQVSEQSVLIEGERGSITLDVTEEYDIETETLDVTGEFTIEGAGSEAVFEFTGAGTDEGGTVEGSLSFNGDEVVIFSGPSDEPEFTQPDGSPLTSAEIGALVQMWEAFVGTYTFVYVALFPFLFLLVFSSF